MTVTYYRSKIGSYGGLYFVECQHLLEIELQPMANSNVAAR